MRHKRDRQTENNRILMKQKEITAVFDQRDRMREREKYLPKNRKKQTQRERKTWEESEQRRDKQENEKKMK